ncbi:hypothetical protein Anapl_02619 [Anas platyrhynchos]|uniref:Uncharacterized protein n=1 Tax=Anas platyrhynchos TaxID=8839 RepID=R0LEH3_ANAPL|nr:hypothetical protein Anapl_02619 [Anas platyrhynchos]
MGDIRGLSEQCGHRALGRSVLSLLAAVLCASWVLFATKLAAFRVEKGEAAGAQSSAVWLARGLASAATFPVYGLGYGFNLGKVKRCFGGLLLTPAPRGDRRLLPPELQAIQTRGVEQGEDAAVRNSPRGHVTLCKAARQLLISKSGAAVSVHFFGASLLLVEARPDREPGINVPSASCSADPVVQLTHPALTALV